MSTDPSNRANNWAAQRKQAIEKAKQAREERKFNLAKAGEMSVANEIGSTHLNRVTSSENHREYQKPPMNDFPLNSRKPATMKYGMSLLDQQPTEEELIQARTSLRLLKSKMKDSNGFPPMARTADQYMDHNQGERRQVGQGYQYNNNNDDQSNGNYRKVFKPSFKDDDYQQMNNNLNRDLTQIDKTLSQKSRPPIGGGGYGNSQSQQTYDPPQYSRPRDNFTKPPIGGNNRNNMYDQNEDFQDFSSKNIPSRLSKNTMSAQKPKPSNMYDEDNYTAQINNKAKNVGNKGYMEEDSPIPRKNYQDYEYKPQQRSQENPLAKNNFGSDFGNKPNNKGWPSNTSNANNAYNNKQQAFDDRDNDNSAVFSKPNLKKAQPPAPYNRQNDDIDNRPPKGASNNNPYNRQSQSNEDFDNRQLKGAGNNKPYSRQPQNNDDSDNRSLRGASNASQNQQYNRQPQNKLDELDNRPLKGSDNNMPSEFAPKNSGPLEECPHGCGRSFNADVIEKHAKICQKVFQSKRKKFDSAAQRESEDQPDSGYDNNRYNPPKNYKAPPGKSAAAGGKSAKWKQQSEAFRANLKAARGEELSQEEQVKLAKASTDHLVPCPSCGRKFNENAAARHIPFCESKQKVDTIKKGGKGKR